MTTELERLALAEWPEAAEARVVAVSVSGDRAEVAMVVNAREQWQYFVRDGSGRWRQAVSGNAPTVGWEDPDAIHWNGRD